MFAFGNAVYFFFYQWNEIFVTDVIIFQLYLALKLVSQTEKNKIEHDRVFTNIETQFMTFIMYHLAATSFNDKMFIINILSLLHLVCIPARSLNRTALVVWLIHALFSLHDY